MRCSDPPPSRRSGRAGTSSPDSITSATRPLDLNVARLISRRDSQSFRLPHPVGCPPLREECGGKLVSSREVGSGERPVCAKPCGTWFGGCRQAQRPPAQPLLLSGRFASAILGRGVLVAIAKPGDPVPNTRALQNQYRAKTGGPIAICDERGAAVLLPASRQKKIINGARHVVRGRPVQTYPVRTRDVHTQSDRRSSRGEEQAKGGCLLPDRPFLCPP